MSLYNLLPFKGNTKNNLPFVGGLAPASRSLIQLLLITKAAEGQGAGSGDAGLSPSLGGLSKPIPPTPVELGEGEEGEENEEGEEGEDERFPLNGPLTVELLKMAHLLQGIDDEADAYMQRAKDEGFWDANKELILPKPFGKPKKPAATASTGSATVRSSTPGRPPKKKPEPATAAGFTAPTTVFRSANGFVNYSPEPTIQIKQTGLTGLRSVFYFRDRNHNRAVSKTETEKMVVLFALNQVEGSVYWSAVTKALKNTIWDGALAKLMPSTVILESIKLTPFDFNGNIDSPFIQPFNLKGQVKDPTVVASPAPYALSMYSSLLTVSARNQHQILVPKLAQAKSDSFMPANDSIEEGMEKFAATLTNGITVTERRNSCTLTLLLETRGRNQVSFVVDGEYFTTPFAPVTNICPFGFTNSRPFNNFESQYLSTDYENGSDTGLTKPSSAPGFNPLNSGVVKALTTGAASGEADS